MLAKPNVILKKLLSCYSKQLTGGASIDYFTHHHNRTKYSLGNCDCIDTDAKFNLVPFNYASKLHYITYTD